MQALVCLGLMLGNLSLLVHLSEKAIRLRKSWKDHRLLVNNHPEMKSVDPNQGLLAFKSDDLIRAFVLDNQEQASVSPSTYRTTNQMNNLMTSVMLLWIIQVDLRMYSFQS